MHTTPNARLGDSENGVVSFFLRPVRQVRLSWIHDNLNILTHILIYLEHLALFSSTWAPIRFCQLHRPTTVYKAVHHRLLSTIFAILLSVRSHGVPDLVSPGRLLKASRLTATGNEYPQFASCPGLATSTEKPIVEVL